jgi:hypothetical protein
MKKLLLVLLISIGLIGIYSDYKLAEKKASLISQGNVIEAFFSASL